MTGSRVKRSWWTAAALVLLLVVGVSGCGSASLASGTRPMIKIGLAAPFEGLYRPIGYEALRGVKLALAQRNAAGGVGGYMVELVALDDSNDPDDARQQALEFAVDPAVVGVVTGWSGDLAGASLPVYRENGLAVVVPWVVSPDLADAEAGIVLAAADGEQVARRLAGQTSAFDPQNVILVGDQDWSPGTVALQPSHSNLVFLAAPSGVVDPADSVVREVLNWPAQSSLLVLGLDSVPAGQILLALNEAGWQTAVLGTAGAGSVHLANVAGRAADGVLFASPAPNGRDVNVTPPSPKTPLDQLGPRAVMSYDATLVLLEAIERSIEADGRPTRHGVIDVLPGLQVSGLTGEIVIDNQARRANAPVWFYRITGGQYPGEVVPAAAD